MSDASDIAPDLPHETRARLLALTTASPRRAAPLRISTEAIHHWCEAFEDAHGAYRPEDPSRTRAVAPLGSVLSTFVLPYTWPSLEDAEPPLRHIHHDVKALLDLPSAVVGKVAVEQFAALSAGDRISVEQRLVSVSPRKRTALGEGRFWEIERRYFGDAGTLSVRERMSSFGFAPTELSNVRPSSAESRQDDRARRVADPQSGDPLPDLSMQITPLRATLVASATRDFTAVHLDGEHARRVAGTRGAFMSREFHIGIVSRFLTDWGGKECHVRRITLHLRRPLCVGDDLVVKGHTLSQNVECAELSLELRNSQEVVSFGAATVAWSDRRGAPMGR